jgi:hypothetical protein
LPNAVEPSPDPASHTRLADLNTQPTTPPAGQGVLFQSFLFQMLLQRHHYPCNARRPTHRHSPWDTIMRAMYATNLTLSTMPRVQDLTAVTVPLHSVLPFRMEDKLDNRRTTGRLYFSSPDTCRLPSGPGCNSSYNYSSATWVHSVHSSVTKTYMTSFDVKRYLRYFQIA